MFRTGLALVLTAAVLTPVSAAENVVKVADDAALRRALGSARPGTRIQIAPGRYRPGGRWARINSRGST